MTKKSFNILNNVVGKTKYLASAYIANNCYGIFKSGSYIFVACGTSKLNVYTFNGTSFTLVTTSSEASTYYDVWGDGTYIYALCYNGVRVYSFNGTTLTQLSFNTTYSGFNNRSTIWGDGTYIYCTGGAADLYAYSFNGATLTARGSLFQGGTNFYGLWTDGTYFYTNKDNAVRAYTFNGSVFSYVNGYNITSTGYDVWGDGTHIYAIRQGEYVYQLTFNGTAFTLIKTWNISKSAQSFLSLWGDGKYIYVAGSSWGLYTLEFSSVKPWQKCENRHKVWLMGITGDANYIYVSSATEGIHAFKLLEKYQ